MYLPNLARLSNIKILRSFITYNIVLVINGKFIKNITTMIDKVNISILFRIFIIDIIL